MLFGGPGPVSTTQLTVETGVVYDPFEQRRWTPLHRWGVGDPDPVYFHLILFLTPYTINK